MRCSDNDQTAEGSKLLRKNNTDVWLLKITLAKRSHKIKTLFT